MSTVKKKKKKNDNNLQRAQLQPQVLLSIQGEIFQSFKNQKFILVI